MLRLGVVALLMLSSLARAQETTISLGEARAAFEKADRSLNQAWAAFRPTLPPEVFNMAKYKQREWLEARDQQALLASGATDITRAKLSPSYFTTAAALTQARADWFRQRVVNKDEVMTGCWLDGYGGEIDIVQQKGRLLFLLEVARAHGDPKLGNVNLGDLAGIALWNETIGWFSDKGRDSTKPDETNISFVLRDGRKLEITEANAHHYQGMAVSFDGIYYKVTPLNEDEQRKVMKAAESGEITDD